jgi:hypothetical protein
VLDRLRSPRTVDEVADSCGLPRDQVAETLYGLWNAGLVTTEAPSEEETDTRPYRRQVDEERLSSEQLLERARIMRLALSVTTMNHYTALGVEEDAGHGLVVKAWQEAEQSYDPGRVAEAHLADLRDELSSIHRRAELAYEVLSEPSSRKRYDQLLHASPDGSPSVIPELEDERQTEATRELVEGNLRQAEELIQSGQGRHAFTFLESASQMARDEDTLLKLADLAGRDPAWGRLALDALKRLTSSYPGCIEAWIVLANHWLGRDDPERQRKALERALTVDPDSEIAQELYLEHFGSQALDRVLRRTETMPEWSPPSSHDSTQHDDEM